MKRARFIKYLKKKLVSNSVEIGKIKSFVHVLDKEAEFKIDFKNSILPPNARIEGNIIYV